MGKVRVRVRLMGKVRVRVWDAADPSCGSRVLLRVMGKGNGKVRVRVWDAADPFRGGFPISMPCTLPYLNALHINALHITRM